VVGEDVERGHRWNPEARVDRSNGEADARDRIAGAEQDFLEPLGLPVVVA
jgi:hypothetical protein